MLSTGFPDDEDPNLVDDPECPTCGNILDVGNGEVLCKNCNFHDEVDIPDPPDYWDYNGPTPYNHLD